MTSATAASKTMAHSVGISPSKLKPVCMIPSHNPGVAGATVETVTAAVAQELGLPFSTRGVLVREVAINSPAHEMGLRTGDLILSLNGQPTVDAASFGQVANARPRQWQVELQRGGRLICATVQG
jgi:S1-C subfamily serine protease